jgi:hypothetical protein
VNSGQKCHGSFRLESRTGDWIYAAAHEQQINKHTQIESKPKNVADMRAWRSNELAACKNHCKKTPMRIAIKPHCQMRNEISKFSPPHPSICCGAHFKLQPNESGEHKNKRTSSYLSM